MSHQELAQIETDIKSLEKRKYDLLGKIRLGTIIRFPGKDMVVAFTSGVSDKQKELVFVTEGAGDKVGLVNIVGNCYRHHQVSDSFVPREFVLDLIEEHNGEILSNDIHDILEHYSKYF